MRIWLATFAMVLFGCGGDSPHESPGTDASADAARDAASGDEASADAPAPDVGPDVPGAEPTPDGPASEVAPDFGPGDVATSDAPTPDAPAPDIGPDLGVQDTGALDLGIPDVSPDSAILPDMGADGPTLPCVPVTGSPPLGLEEVVPPPGFAFAQPVDIQSPPDDPRLFIVEQGGVIRIIDSGVVLAAPFLDMSAQVSTGGNEEGLLGLAFHPDYATNGRFFVYYVDLGSDLQISEFLVSADPNVANDMSETPVLSVPHPGATNHNGGALAFGPNDGYLYIAVGDGGSGCDPGDDGQSTMSLLGKILRIDVTVLPYIIPPTNPFFGSLTQDNEIWAYGLRNPWRISFDRQTADLYIGDVGQNEWEEIDVQPSVSSGGENYGWNDWEAGVCQDGSPGTSCNTAASCSMAGFTFPTHAYPHSASLNCFGVAGSVTGGYVYRGCRTPDYLGYYFYADYCLGTVHSFVYSGGTAMNLLDWPSLDSTASTFGQDYLGELYIADINTGTIYRISPM